MTDIADGSWWRNVLVMVLAILVTDAFYLLIYLTFVTIIQKLSPASHRQQTAADWLKQAELLVQFLDVAGIFNDQNFEKLVKSDKNFLAED